MTLLRPLPPDRWTTDHETINKPKYKRVTAGRRSSVRNHFLSPVQRRLKAMRQGSKNGQPACREAGFWIGYNSKLPAKNLLKTPGKRQPCHQGRSLPNEPLIWKMCFLISPSMAALATRATAVVTRYDLNPAQAQNRSASSRLPMILHAR